MQYARLYLACCKVNVNMYAYCNSLFQIKRKFSNINTGLIGKMNATNKNISKMNYECKMRFATKESINERRSYLSLIDALILHSL